MLKKIGVIGGGNIGGVLIQEIARRKLARSVGLMDVLEPDFAKGKCLDIAEGTPIVNLDVEMTGAKDYSAIKGADLVINTAGVPRKKRPTARARPAKICFGPTWGSRRRWPRASRTTRRRPR